MSLKSTVIDLDPGYRLGSKEVNCGYRWLWMLVSLWARLHVLQTCWHLGHDQHRTPVSFGSGPWGTLERWVLLAPTALLLGLWMLRVGAQVETEVNWATPLRPLSAVARSLEAEAGTVLGEGAQFVELHPSHIPQPRP